MKFSIPLIDLESLLKAVLPSRVLKADTIALYACAARVFVASRGTVAGIEALVLADGAVRLPAKAFRELLKTYKGTRVLVFEGGADGLRVQNFHMPVLGYEPSPKPPGEFQVFCSSAPPGASPSRE